MKIGVISAIYGEIQSFIESMENISTHRHAMLDFYCGDFTGVPVVAVAGGVCKVNAAIAAQVCIGSFGVTHIIMAGVAGAIDPGLSIADTVISADLAYHDVSPGILTQDHPRMESPYFPADPAMLAAARTVFAGDASVRFGRLATGEAFIDSDSRQAIIDNHNPLCVDMESAAVAHVCHANRVPFIAIRSISDTPHEHGDDAFRRYFIKAADKSIAVLKRLIPAL